MQHVAMGAAQFHVSPVLLHLRTQLPGRHIDDIQPVALGNRPLHHGHFAQFPIRVGDLPGQSELIAGLAVFLKGDVDLSQHCHR